MVATGLTYPGWLRIFLTAVITALCTAGLVAAILVWHLTPTPTPTPTPTSSSSSLPSPAVNNVADDAGGEGSAPVNQENPFRKALKRNIIYHLMSCNEAFDLNMIVLVS